MPSSRIIVCADCGKERKHAAHSLCHTCYSRWYRREGMGQKVICVECGEKKVHAGKGRCKRCYDNYYRRTHPEFAEYTRIKANRWYYANKERALKYASNWKKWNREKVNESNRRWMERNPEKMRAIRGAYDAANRERSRFHASKRRTRIRGAIDILTFKEAGELLKIGQATYPGKKIELDHFIPISKGGGITRGNIHAIPRNINRWKGSKLPQEIYAQLSLEDCYA